MNEPLDKPPLGNLRSYPPSPTSADLDAEEGPIEVDDDGPNDGPVIWLAAALIIGALAMFWIAL